MTAFRGFGGKKNNEPGRAVTPEGFGSKEGSGPHLRTRPIEPRRGVARDAPDEGEDRNKVAEGRLFYAGPQALYEPTAGRCYTETTQDGKRKITVGRATAVLSRRGYPEGASDK